MASAVDQYDSDDLPPAYSELFPDCDDGDGETGGGDGSSDATAGRPGSERSIPSEPPPPYTPSADVPWTQPAPPPLRAPRAITRTESRATPSSPELVVLPKNPEHPLSMRCGPMYGYFSDMCIAVPEQRLLLRTYKVSPPTMYSFTEFDLNTLSVVGGGQQLMTASAEGESYHLLRDRGYESICLDTTRGSIITTAPQEIMIIAEEDAAYKLARRIGPTDIGALQNAKLKSVSYDKTHDVIAVVDMSNRRVLLVKHTEPPSLVRQFGDDVLQQPVSVVFVHSPRFTYLAVSDMGSHCVTIFSMSGEPTKRFGSLGSGGAHLSQPHGVCVDPNGKIIVADRANGRVVCYWRAERCDHWQCLLDAEDLEGEWPEHVDLCASSNTLVVITRNARVTGEPHTVRTFHGLEQAFLTRRTARGLRQTPSAATAPPPEPERPSADRPNYPTPSAATAPPPEPERPPADRPNSPQVTRDMQRLSIGPNAAPAAPRTSPPAPNPALLPSEHGASARGAEAAAADPVTQLSAEKRLVPHLTGSPSGAHISDVCVIPYTKQLILRVYRPNASLMYAYSVYDLSTLQQVVYYEQVAVVPYKVGLAPAVQARLVAKTRALMDNGDEAICMDMRRGLFITIAPQHIMLINRDNQLVERIGDDEVAVLAEARLCSVAFDEQHDLVAVADCKKNRVLFVDHINKRLRLAFGAEHLRRPTAIRFFTSPRATYLAVCDTGNHCVRIYDMAGQLNKTYGGHGRADRCLDQPRGLCVDPGGRVIVADRMNKRVVAYFRARGRDHWKCLLDRADLCDEYPEHVDVCAPADTLVVVTKNYACDSAEQNHTIRTFSGLTNALNITWKTEV